MFPGGLWLQLEPLYTQHRGFIEVITGVRSPGATCGRRPRPHANTQNRQGEETQEESHRHGNTKHTHKGEGRAAMRSWQLSLPREDNIPEKVWRKLFILRLVLLGLSTQFKNWYIAASYVFPVWYVSYFGVWFYLLICTLLLFVLCFNLY